MNNFFLNGYPSDDFKSKDDCITYLIDGRFNDISLLDRIDFTDKYFKGIATQEEMDKYIIYVPKQIEDVIESLITKSNSFCLEYEDCGDKYFYEINKDEFFSNESLDKLIKKYNYRSDIGVYFYGDKEDWAYFYGENLYEGFLEPDTWESFHLFIIKKTFQKNFLDTIKRVTKNKMI
ncbi:MAG: hypothetical protein ACWIPJ_10860, partial [Polaribacter sp.]